MSGYRNDLEAAQRRIDTLEAQLAERDASLKARRAEIAELENKVRRTPLGRARARGVWAAVSAGVLVALVGGGLVGLKVGAFVEQQAQHAARGGMDRPEAVVQVAEPPTEVSQPPHIDVIDPWTDEGDATLVAIAIGGSCAFEVDGNSRGTRSSIRVKVSEGEHVVNCIADGTSRTQRVNAKRGKPAIASFRL